MKPGDTIVINLTGEKAIYINAIPDTNIVRVQLIDTDEIVEVLTTDIDYYFLSEVV